MNLGVAAMPRVTDTALSAHKMPQLDALRAFAALSVLFAHFVSYPPRWLTIVPWAACGVLLFFVLSGFLITGILLDSRKQVEAGVSRLWMLRQFYIRRFLRIFPLYYAVILAGRIAQWPGFTKTFGWNLAYLTNFYIISKAGWIGAASYLWTLSVEEQFYLVWPWIILFLPKRWLLPMFVSVVIFASVYRVIAIGWFGPWLNLAPFGSLDCFGAGALLALAQRREKEGKPQLRRTVCTIGLWLGAPLLILALALGWRFPLRPDQQTWNLMSLALTLLFTPLISRAAHGFTGVIGFFLTRRPTQYIGRISYGIYIYHLPVQWAITSKASKWLNGLPWFIPHSLLFLVATIALAALSWHFFERPVNQLKRLFPYRANGLRSRPEMPLRAAKEE
jgi:peptidoglycan/LPS O-acetylase OafA/YrhL